MKSFRQYLLLSESFLDQVLHVQKRKNQVLDFAKKNNIPLSTTLGTLPTKNIKPEDGISYESDKESTNLARFQRLNDTARGIGKSGIFQTLIDTMKTKIPRLKSSFQVKLQTPGVFDTASEYSDAEGLELPQLGDVHVPIRSSAGNSTRALAHELGHQWQTDQKIKQTLRNNPEDNPIARILQRFTPEINRNIPNRGKPQSPIPFMRMPPMNSWMLAPEQDRINFRNHPLFKAHAKGWKTYINSESEVNARSVEAAVNIADNYHATLRQHMIMDQEAIQKDPTRTPVFGSTVESVNRWQNGYRTLFLKKAEELEGIFTGTINPHTQDPLWHKVPLSMEDRKSMAKHSQEILTGTSRDRFRKNISTILKHFEGQLPQDLHTPEGRQRYIDHGV